MTEIAYYPPIAASESKTTFMISIGLQPGQLEDERIYKLMKEDAVYAYRKVVRDQWDAAPDAAKIDSKQPRYAYTEIDKDTIQQAIAAIYARASVETRVYYDRGRSTDGSETNWVIRWMLWHTFRYRDSRNKRPPAGSSGSWQDHRVDFPDATDTASTSPVDDEATFNSTMDTTLQPTSWLYARPDPQSSSKAPGRPLPYDPTKD